MREVNRAQLEWRPVDLDALLPEDHSARMVSEYVARLDAEVQVQALRAEVDADPALPGLRRDRQTGSHLTLWHAQRGTAVTVSVHTGIDIGRGLAARIRLR